MEILYCSQKDITNVLPSIHLIHHLNISSTQYLILGYTLKLVMCLKEPIHIIILLVSYRTCRQMYMPILQSQNKFYLELSRLVKEESVPESYCTCSSSLDILNVEIRC